MVGEVRLPLYSSYNSMALTYKKIYIYILLVRPTTNQSSATVIHPPPYICILAMICVSVIFFTQGVVTKQIQTYNQSE